MRFKTTIIISIVIILLAMLFIVLYEPLTGHVFGRERGRLMGQGTAYLLVYVWLLYIFFGCRAKANNLYGCVKEPA